MSMLYQEKGYFINFVLAPYSTYPHRRDFRKRFIPQKFCQKNSITQGVNNFVTGLLQPPLSCFCSVTISKSNNTK